MSSILEYKCPNCASDIKFDPSSQKFKCESCDAFFSEDALNEIHNFEQVLTNMYVSPAQHTLRLKKQQRQANALTAEAR